jgi:hypothetical protein
MREICARHGLDWDRPTDEDRERLVDELKHEAWPCQSTPPSIGGLQTPERSRSSGVTLRRCDPWLDDGGVSG